MRKVFMMLWIIGLIGGVAGLDTAFGAPVLTGIKIGTGTHPDAGVDISPDGNTYTVKGTGNDIWGTNDSFEFAFIEVSGNFDISCRLANFTTTNTADGWSKAGVMVRQNINTDGASPMAYFVASLHGTPGSANNGLSWATRNTSGTTASASNMAYSLPVYLRMTRTGNIFTAYYSQDGISWTKATGDADMPADYTMVLTDPVYIGLAACPHRETAGSPDLATAEFDHVNIFKPTPEDKKINVDYGASTLLKWDAVVYPSGFPDWTVYFGAEPNDLTAAVLGTVSDPTREIASPILAANTTYYWRVDATKPMDPNVSRGVWWSFTTKSTKPVITDQPDSTMAALNCPGMFNATARSGDLNDQGPMTFVWKNLAGDTLKTDSNVTTSEFQTGVVGTYYVEVSNSNGTTKSNEVTLSTKALTFINFGTAAPGTGMTFDGASYTLTGSGADIWGTSDGCAFAYLPVTGDGTITARVTNITGNTLDGGWTKAGLMLRESLNANAMELTMVASKAGNPAEEYNRNVFQWRNATGGSTANSASNGNEPPKWLRLVRAGNSYSGYYSNDGVTWTQQGSTQTFTMSANAYVGLAITAHNNASLSTVILDNITSTWPFGWDWKVTTPKVSPLTTEGWVDPSKAATLSWTKSDLGPCGATYTVYASLNPDPTQSPLFTSTTAADEMKFDISANSLPFSKTIYWRVDTNSGGQTVTGTVWSFNTVMQYPVIATHPALITVVDKGAAANLNVVATTATVPFLVPMVKYQWYQVTSGGDVKVGPEGTPIDDGAGNYSCPLALINIQLANEGEYYCVVTNEVGDTSSNKGRVLTHRMVLHYTFEQVVNNVIADQSSSGINATLIEPSGGKGPVYDLVDGGIGLGKAIKLIGPNDPNGAYITTNKKPMELGINGNFPRSVSVWAKAQAFNNGGLFDMGAYVAGQNFCLRTLAGYNNRWRVQYYSMDRDTDVIPSYDEWVHFVLVYDGVYSQLYVNGQLARDVNGNFINYYAELDTQNANNVVIGRYQNDVNRYIGLIDDFRLYNYALTAEDAAQLYLAVKGGTICLPSTYDLDGDCEVNMSDFAILAGQWAQTGIANP